MNPCGGMLSFAQVATLRVCVGSWLRRPGCRGRKRKWTAGVEAKVVHADHPFATRRAKHCKVMVGGEQLRQGQIPCQGAKQGRLHDCSILCNATPRRLLVKVELVHEAASVAKPRWLASLVRWTESRTSLGSVLKFAGWPDGHRCRGVEEGEVV